MVVMIVARVVFMSVVIVVMAAMVVMVMVIVSVGVVVMAFVIAMIVAVMSVGVVWGSQPALPFRPEDSDSP